MLVPASVCVGFQSGRRMIRAPGTPTATKMIQLPHHSFR